MRLLRFWQKSCLFRYAFLLQYKNDDCLLTFCLDNIFGKNQVLELRSSNLKTNQNALFFKLQYLTNKLSYIYDVFGVFGYDKSSVKAININWVLSEITGHAQSDEK